MEPPRTMQRVSEFVFEPEDTTIASLLPTDTRKKPSPPTLRVKVSQIVDEDFGGYLWPSSHPLAWFIWQHASDIKGKRVLELGAGTGLPGIVAAKLGAHVTLTDHPAYTTVLDNCKASVALNNLECPIEPLEWGDLDAPVVARLTPDSAPDVVIGADIFYNSKDFEDLFATIGHLMELNPRLVVWTTYQNRSRHNVISFLLRKWGINATVTDIDEFYPESHRARLHADVMLITLTRGELET